jgi:septal ring factor EnvC (AmiA/AmiB activator)
LDVAAPHRKLSADIVVRAGVNTKLRGTLRQRNIRHKTMTPGDGFAIATRWNTVCQLGDIKPGSCIRPDVHQERHMNEKEFQTKLAELMGEISTLPATERAKLEKIATETRARHDRLRATVSSLQESLDYLRLSIKYLVFDLEATRRENGYLRKMLEETSGGND